MYNPWGEVSATGSNASATNLPFKYNGRDGVFRHEATNLYWMRARHYKPDQGRFMQVDPEPAQPQTADTGYSYAGSDPVNKTDPSGRSALRRYLGHYIMELTQKDAADSPVNQVTLSVYFSFYYSGKSRVIVGGFCQQDEETWTYPVVSSGWTIEKQSFARFTKGKKFARCTTKKIVAKNSDPFMGCDPQQSDPPKDSEYVRSHYSNLQVKVTAAGKVSHKEKRWTTGTACRHLLHKEEMFLKYIPKKEKE